MNTMAAGTTAPGGAGDRQPEGLLLTVDEAAERLRLGRTLVYRLISSGEPESVTVGSCGGSPPGASPSTLPHCAAHSASRESLAAALAALKP